MTNTNQEFYREFNLFVKHAMADKNQTLPQLNFITQLCFIIAEHRGDYNDNWDQWMDNNIDSNGNCK